MEVAAMGRGRLFDAFTLRPYVDFFISSPRRQATTSYRLRPLFFSPAPYAMPRHAFYDTTPEHHCFFATFLRPYAMLYESAHFFTLIDVR